MDNWDNEEECEKMEWDLEKDPVMTDPRSEFRSRLEPELVKKQRDVRCVAQRGQS